MNYLEKYLALYPGENKKQIYRMVDAFCGCVRTGELDPVRAMLTEDCVADISMIGPGLTGDAILEALQFPRDDMDVRRLNIFNYVCRIHDNLGQIYFYTQSVVAKDDGENIFPFVFGGQFCMTVVKEAGAWKFSAIKYDLMFEQGNSCFVGGKWKLMNYSQFYGHTPMIFHETDSPWVVIPEDDEPESELGELINGGRSGYAMDAASFAELYDLSTEPRSGSPSLGVRKNVTKGGGTQDTGKKISGRKANVNFQKEKVHKEARLQHTTMLGDMKVIGDKRYQVRLRSEYNRLYNCMWDRQNIHAIPSTVVHPSVQILEDGVWQPWATGFDGRVVFLPVDDDCIRYDDYICGGRKWIGEDGSILT